MLRMLCFCFASLLIAQDKPAAPRPPFGVPKDAQRIEGGSWRWRDKDGAVWIFSPGPTGFSRAREEDVKKLEASSRSLPLVVEAKGGNVTFLVPTPFGGSRWTKPLAALDDDEKAAFELWQKARDANTAKTTAAEKR